MPRPSAGVIAAAVCLVALLAAPSFALPSDGGTETGTDATATAPTTMTTSSGYSDNEVRGAKIALEDAIAGAQPLEQLLRDTVLPDGLYATPDDVLAHAGHTKGSGSRRHLLDSECSTTDTSAEAVFRCTNAVRQNPSIMSDAPCYNNVKNEISSPHRNALAASSQLTAAAVKHNDRMVSYNQMSHRLPNEPDFGARIKADSGLSNMACAENVAMGYGSARHVVMGWLCSEGHRRNMFSCDYNQAGMASRNKFYTQVFSCPGGGCNSCGAQQPIDDNSYDWIELRPWTDSNLDKCVDIQYGKAEGNGVPLWQWGCNKTPAQKFRFAAAGDGWFNLVDAWGRCVDVAAPPGGGGGELLVWECHGAANQQFSFEKVADYTYRIRVRSSNQCVAVTCSRREDGLRFQQEPCEANNGNQMFVLFAFD